MSLELGSRFRLPDGRLVEVVPDVAKILGMKVSNICMRCCLRFNSVVDCVSVGCLSSAPHLTKDLEVWYPRILKEVENE
jgi:hypothetical protein